MLPAFLGKLFTMVSFAQFRTTIALLLGSCLALSSRPSPRGRPSSGYFSRVAQLPPLPSTDGTYGASIPVCYTNAPDSLDRWLSDHIPFDGATIGFDLEVRFPNGFIECRCNNWCVYVCMCRESNDNKMILYSQCRQQRLDDSKSRPILELAFLL
jgi:hypothetical protein